MTLQPIQSRFQEIAAQLGSTTTLATTPQHDGSPHAEHVGDTYFYVVTERGSELERRETKDPDELLSWFVRGLTFSMAIEWELKHRIPSQDTRRLLFKKHVELLRGIRELWADQEQAYYDDVLKQYPFDDMSGDRVDYCVNLQKQGIKDEEAWQRALLKYPKPKDK